MAAPQEDGCLLSALQRLLPAQAPPPFEMGADQFRQVHRSTIVNMHHVEGTRRDELSRLFVRMRGQVRELPVSRAYVHLFKAM